MNYLVMETHPAYAVVLDEEGRFLKAANLHYQVGDTVQEIVELQTPQKKPVSFWKPLSGLVGLAACFCLVFFGYYQPNFTPYGALRIQINPDVELTLSRTDRVLELKGLNADGEDLIAGYHFGGKDREDVTEELVDRAIAMGYLSGGETVSITVTSADADWQTQEEQRAREDLEERYGETIVIQVGPAAEEPPATEVVIPVTPPTTAPESDPEPTTVSTPEPVQEPTPTPSLQPSVPPTVSENPDYGAVSGGETSYNDTDYGSSADGVTDYEPSDDGSYNAGATDYEDGDDEDNDQDDEDDGGDDLDEDD